MTFNKKLLYPFTYGDLILDDEERLSNFIVEVAKNKKVQNVASVIFWTTLTLGGQANAMPLEAGEYIVNVVAEAAVEGGKAANLIPEKARVAAGGVNDAA